jgi:hypothetical protein
MANALFERCANYAKHKVNKKWAKSIVTGIKLGSVAKFVSFSDNWPILVIEKSDDQF